MAADTLPVPVAAGASAAPSFASFAQRLPFGPRLTELLHNPLLRRSLPALIMGGAVGLSALAWMLFSSPDQRALYPQASEEDRAAMADVLSSANVPYSVSEQNGTISVAADSYYRARMLLAEQGLPASGATAGDDLASIPMGASRAVEGEHVRTSRESDLARTIEQIDVVETARIHIAEPPPTVFLRDNDRPTASVMLTLKPGRTMSDAQVQAVMGLVAASLPGLDPGHVSIVDQRGQLLSQQAMLSGSDAERQFALQQRVESNYQRSIAALLTPIVGADNFTTEVHADLDFSQTQSTRETVPTGTPVVETEIGQISTDAASAPAVGIPGTLSNVPPPLATPSITPPAPTTTPGAVPNANRNENYNRRFALGREVAVTQAQAPNLQRLTVAVALRNPPGGRPRSAAEIQALDALVKGAVGFDAARGDLVAINARAFTPVVVPQESWWQAAWVEPMVRNITALAIAALLLFGLFWPLFRRYSKARAARQSDLLVQQLNAQLTGPGTNGDAPSAGREGKITLDMIDHVQGYEARAEMIRAFVRQDPDRATLVIRDLIKNDVDAGGGTHG